MNASIRAPLDRGETGLLRERAARLAQGAPVSQPTLEVVVFADSSGARYALGLEALRLVVREPVTALPGVSPWMAGLVNVRGELRAVVDLAVVYGKTAPGTPGDCVLLVDSARGEVGLSAHGVPELRRVPNDSLQAPLSGTRGVRGILNTDVALLDVDALLEGLEG